MLSVSLAQCEIILGTEDCCLKIHFIVIFMAMLDNKIKREMTGITIASHPRKKGKEGVVIQRLMYEASCLSKQSTYICICMESLL